MPFFYVAAGGTLVLAVRLALRFLRRNDEECVKDDLFFTDDDAGASTACLNSGVRGIAHKGVPLQRRPAGVVNEVLPTRSSLKNNLTCNGAHQQQQWPLIEENLQVISGLRHNVYSGNAPDICSASVSSSEARRRAVSVLKVRNWDDAGAAQDWGQEEGSRGGSTGGSGSGDERPRLAAAGSAGSSLSSGRPAGALSLTGAAAISGEGPSPNGLATGIVSLAQPLAGPGQPQPPPPPQQQQQQREGPGAPHLMDSVFGSGLTGSSLRARTGAGTSGASLTAASSLVGNCSRNSATDTTSVPLRSCGTGTGTISSSSPDTSQTADLQEQRSETESESRRAARPQKCSSRADGGAGAGAEACGDAASTSAAALAAEVVAAAREEQVAAVVEAAAAAEPVIAAAAAVMVAEAVDSDHDSRGPGGLPAALWAPASPSVPEPTPLPPTILETRAPDPSALLAIQQQIEALRLQHLQRQAQALLTAPAASRAAPSLPATADAGGRAAGPGGLHHPVSSPAVAPGSARGASLLGTSPRTSALGMGFPGGAVGGGGGTARTPALSSRPSSPETTLLGMAPGPLSPAGGAAAQSAGAASPRPRVYAGSSSGLSVDGGAQGAGGWGDGGGGGRGQGGGRASTGSSYGYGETAGSTVLTDDFLQQLIQRPSLPGLMRPQPAQQQQQPVQHGFQQQQQQQQQQQPQQLQQQVWGAGVQQMVPMAAQRQPQQPAASHTAPAASQQQAGSGPSGQAQWPDAAVQAARMSTLQLEAKQQQQQQQQLLQQQQQHQAQRTQSPGGVGVSPTSANPQHPQLPHMLMQQQRGATEWAVGAGSAPGAGAGAAAGPRTLSPHSIFQDLPSASQSAAAQTRPVQQQQQLQQLQQLQQAAAGQVPQALGPYGHSHSLMHPQQHPSSTTMQGALHHSSSAPHPVPNAHPHLHPHPHSNQHPNQHPNPMGMAGSPPRSATTAAASSDLLSSPPSFRHHLRPGEGIQESESAKRTQDWINSTRLDDPASPTLRPHPPPTRLATESASGGPLPHPQSPGRLQLSPSLRHASPSMRHQDTLESHRSGGGGAGGEGAGGPGSAHGSRHNSRHGSRHDSHHGSRRHGSAARHRKMEQALLQAKLANQAPPSPLALYSARLLHQAGEKLVPAPRMPGSGGAFFVPLKHELRLDISSRVDSSAVSVSQEDLSSSPHSGTTGLGDIQASHVSATTGNGPQGRMGFGGQSTTAYSAQSTVGFGAQSTTGFGAQSTTGFTAQSPTGFVPQGARLSPTRMGLRQ